MRPKQFFNDVFFNTVQITAVTPDGFLSGSSSIAQSGSGKPLPQRISQLLCNRSLIEKANGKIALRFNLQNVNGGIGEVGEIIEQTESDMDVFGLHAPLYLEHPDKSIDLACIDISPYLGGYYPNDGYGIYYRALTPEWFAEGSLLNLPPDPNVFLLGFPHGVHITHNLPLCRGFRMPDLGSTIEQGNAPFELKAPLLGGCGGGPLFVETNNEHRLIGLLSAPCAITGEDAGVGTVVPLTAVRELLNLAVERANEPQFKRKFPRYRGKPHLMLDYALAVW